MLRRNSGGGHTRLAVFGEPRLGCDGGTTLPFYWADAFTDRSFAGNSAAASPAAHPSSIHNEGKRVIEYVV
jgi:hypothetical protein